MSFIELCRKAIAIDSTPANGNVDIVNFYASLAREYGLTTEILAENYKGIEQANLLVSFSDVNNLDDGLLLQGHLDTYDPGNYSQWTSGNPFQALIYDDKLSGLGVASPKLDFLCKLEACRRVQHKKLNKPLGLLGTFGEVTGMVGALRFIRRKKIRPKYALIAEPTNMQLLHEGAGRVNVEISIPFNEQETQYRRQHNLAEQSTTQSKIFYGQASQSLTSNFDNNAIIQMLEYLAKLPEGTAIMELEGGVSPTTTPASAVMEIDLVGSLRETIVKKIPSILSGLKDLNEDFKKFPSEGFMSPHSTMNMGMVRTRSEEVRLMGCCRILPSVPEEAYEAWMNKLRLICENTEAHFSVTEYKRPFKTQQESHFLETCKQVLEAEGVTTDLGKTMVCTEASLFSRIGTECLIFGAGQGAGNTHQPDEKIAIADLNKSVEIYTQIISRVCQ